MRRIPRTLLAVGLALLLAAPGMALADAPPGVQAAPAPVVPLLWKVSDADNSVYLLGSFHMLKAEDYPLPAEVEAAFEDAESLLFEVAPEVMQSPETAVRFVAAASYNDGKSTLRDVMSAEAYARLDQMAAATGGAKAMDMFEPWFVSTALTIGVMQQLGFDPQQGLDLVLMSRAGSAGKPAAGLESMEDQLAALDGAPMEEQVASLEEFIMDPQQAVRDLLQLHAQWRAGDVAGLNDSMRREMIEKTPRTYERVNVARNDAWLPRLEARLSAPGTDDTLAVVGALHLMGPDGLVEKLRAKGYKVERLCQACEAK